MPQLRLWKGFIVFAAVAAIGAAFVLVQALRESERDLLLPLASVVASPFYFWYLMRSMRRAHAERREALIAAGVKPIGGPTTG